MGSGEKEFRLEVRPTNYDLQRSCMINAMSSLRDLVLCSSFFIKIKIPSKSVLFNITRIGKGILEILQHLSSYATDNPIYL